MKNLLGENLPVEISSHFIDESGMIYRGIPEHVREVVGGSIQYIANVLKGQKPVTELGLEFVQEAWKKRKLQMLEDRLNSNERTRIERKYNIKPE